MTNLEIEQFLSENFYFLIVVHDANILLYLRIAQLQVSTLKFEKHISDDLSRSCFGRGEHVQERRYIVPIQTFLIKYPGDLFPSNTSSSDLTRLLVTSDFR